MDNTTSSRDQNLSSSAHFPQHLAFRDEADEGSMSSASLEIDQIYINHLSPRASRRRSRTQGEKEVSMQDVYRELSELKRSAKKQALVSGKRPYVSDDDSTASITTYQSEQSSMSSLPVVTDAPHGVFQSLSKDINHLLSALEMQQLELFAQQAEILQLRMSIVNTLMEFEAQSKFIKESLPNQLSESPGENRLTASWPQLPEQEHSQSELNGSWPFLDSSRSSLNESFLDSPDRLSFEMHTIEEEVSAESASDYAASLSPTDTNNSDSSHPSTPQSQRLTFSPNKALSINVLDLEPDGGRLSLTEGESSPRKRSLERIEEPLSSSESSHHSASLGACEPSKGSFSDRKSTNTSSDEELDTYSEFATLA